MNPCAFHLLYEQHGILESLSGMQQLARMQSFRVEEIY